MRAKVMWVLGLGSVVTGLLGHVGTTSATPANGFTGSTIAMGRFGDIDVTSKVLREIGDSTPTKDLWLSMQKTKGPSDLYVQSNQWAVGGSTGWHSHPGHSLIIVTEGSVTAYDADDPSCTGHVFSAGGTTGMVDAGHVHLIRNEGSVVARAIAVQLVPARASRRADEPAPASCPF
jgi:mannose-6-phosphate isomerase-like protein (cupin superfamily)